MRLLSPNAARIIATFLSSPAVPRYGYELMRETGIKSGSLYPILGRFERLGWITRTTEEAVGNRPPRKVYRLQSGAQVEAQVALQRFLDEKQVSVADLPSWGLAT